MRMSPPVPTSLSPVIVAGHHSVGKSTFAIHLASAMDARVIEMGDIVRSEAARRGETNLVRLAERLLRSDPLAIARVAVEVARLGARPVIIVGPRTPGELKHLRSQLSDALVVGLDGSADLRRLRWSQRELTFTDTWDEREEQESAWRTGDILSSCDLLLSAHESLESKVNAVMTRRLLQRA